MIHRGRGLCRLTLFRAGANAGLFKGGGGDLLGLHAKGGGVQLGVSRLAPKTRIFCIQHTCFPPL